MSCGCNESHGVEGVTAPESNPQYPASTANIAGVNYHYGNQCQCGCLELRERVIMLEASLYQLTLIIQNREKAEGEPQQKKRTFIGEKI